MTAVPRFSRSEVDRAGDALIKPAIPANQLDHALDVINNWRSSHSVPLTKELVVLITRTRRYRPGVIVARRIKRLASIQSKLQRFRTMKLSQMQDIGGCRAVLDDVAVLSDLMDAYLASRTKDKLVKVDDYIQNPKSSGYRGIHLVYRYHSDKYPVFNGLQVEIQLRSKLQHTWATAVETVGLMTRQALKSSQGAEKWLRLFSLMGSALSVREGAPLVPGTPRDERELVAELRQLKNELQVERRLHAYRALITSLPNQASRKKDRFWLLEIRPSEGRVDSTGFRADELERATTEYLAVEKTLEQGSEAVLVAVDSVTSLRAAYPNYFADTDAFLRELAEAVGETAP